MTGPKPVALPLGEGPICKTFYHKKTYSAINTPITAELFNYPKNMHAIFRFEEFDYFNDPKEGNDIKTIE